MNGGINLPPEELFKQAKRMEIEAQKEAAFRAQDLTATQNAAQICQNLLINGDKTRNDLPFVDDAHKSAAKFLTAYFEQQYEKLQAGAVSSLAADESFVRV